MRGPGRSVLCLAACLAAGASFADSTRVLEYGDLHGWAEDDHQAALDVFLSTCEDMSDPDWATLCRIGQETGDPRRFFELYFKPTLIEDGTEMLFTGYYEPELDGARERSETYRYPLYALPAEAADGPWLTRAEIEKNAALEGKGLEIAWLGDPVDVYFLQIQGSGRIRLKDGTAIRVGYAGKNGHSYRSVGKELIRRGILEEHAAGAEQIREWVGENGEEGRRALHHNPSYVFFREVSHVPGGKGPLGAMNRSLSALRSVAVDPHVVPLGAPVWIEKEGQEPMQRLMVAQDTGAAVEGAQRADIYFGTGDEAGQEAGTIRDGGRMILLLPIQRAFAQAGAL
jgi:membrane-bound lytic murein transglycosylase A